MLSDQYCHFDDYADRRAFYLIFAIYEWFFLQATQKDWF